MKQTLICPKCGSANVTEDYLTHFAKTAAVDPYKLCKDCGYSAQIFPLVDEKDAQKTQKTIQQTPKDLPETNVDIRCGKFEWAYLKVGAVIIAVVVIALIIYYLFF